MAKRNQESDLPHGTYPEKEPIASVLESEATVVVSKPSLEALPVELIENVLQGISLSELTTLCLVSSKIRSIALRCVQVLSNQKHRYLLSRILSCYKSYFRKFQIKELHLSFPQEVPFSAESEEISQVMALLASWEYRSVQKGFVATSPQVNGCLPYKVLTVIFCYYLVTLELNLFSGENWLIDFCKFASNSLTELSLSFILPSDKTESILFFLLQHLPNLKTLRMDSNSIPVLIQPESSEEVNPQRVHDLTRHDNLTLLNISSDIGDLGIDINLFKSVPNLCTLRMNGDIRGVDPTVLYHTLIEHCPYLQQIMYIDAGFDFIVTREENPVQLYPQATLMYQEDRQSSGAIIRRQFCVCGHDRLQKAKDHIKAILNLYHGPLTEREFDALYEKLPKILTT